MEVSKRRCGIGGKRSVEVHGDACCATFCSFAARGWWRSTLVLKVLHDALQRRSEHLCDDAVWWRRAVRPSHSEGERRTDAYLRRGRLRWWRRLVVLRLPRRIWRSGDHVNGVSVRDSCFCDGFHVGEHPSTVYQTLPVDGNLRLFGDSSFQNGDRVSQGDVAEREFAVLKRFHLYRDMSG